MDWFAQLPDTVQPLWDAVWNGSALVYAWAKEWQILLAGLLVLLAALIVARAVRKTASGVRPRQPLRESAREALQSDLRLAAKPAEADPAPEELVGNLEQLRSLIRSALASLTADKENSPALFLCQRIAHLRLERFPLPLNAGKAAREQHAALLQQLELLRVHLRKESPLPEISEILVRLNASARNLTAALVAAAGGRRQTGSEPY